MWSSHPLKTETELNNQQHIHTPQSNLTYGTDEEPCNDFSFKGTHKNIMVSKVDYKIGCTKSVFIRDMLRIMILLENENHDHTVHCLE